MDKKAEVFAEVRKLKLTFAVITLLISSVLWYFLFVVKPMNFWLEMALSITALVSAAFLSGFRLRFPERLESKLVLLGVASFILLYLIFYIGNIISGFILPFKDAQVLSVYSNKSQGSLLLIGLLLLFVIGPGEEIYWRGYIQSIFSSRFGENSGYVMSVLLYGGVHIVTGNTMLVIAALVCGIYWGWLYKKTKSLVPVIISHALWDLTIFVLLPVK